MALAVPAYVSTAQVAVSHARYDWDEWNVKDYFIEVDEDQFERLDALSDAANLALAIGCGEWICHRLSLLSDDLDPLHYLEAAWAGIVYPGYCPYIETVDDDWRGPVRGPLNMTITIVNDGIRGGDENLEKATHACWMYNLTMHVLPHTDEFEKWFEACVVRFEQSHPKIEDEDDIWEEGPPFGIPIPREALDPSLPYDPGNAPALLDRFLRNLAPAENKFLGKPQDILAYSGFEGTPYRYSPID